MALKFYDEAFLEKIKSWCTDTNITITGPNDTQQLFSVNADLQDDKPISLPLIALRRVGGFNILNTNKQPLTYDGFTKDATIPKSIQINVIPIEISYQIDVYTRYFTEADEYMRNFIFNIINYPRLKILIPYNDIQLEHNSFIRIASDVMDNSDIPERLSVGQFTRFTLQVTIDDAYLWDARIRDNYAIDIEVEA